MVMPCSRSARRPSVRRARSGASWPRLREACSTASNWSVRTDLESCSRRPTSVDLPSSTEPAVANRSSVVAESSSTVIVVMLEVPLALAVFHRGLGELVVGPGGAPLGEPGRGDLGDDLLQGHRVGVDGAGAGHVADGAVAHLPLLDRLAVLGPAPLAGGQPHPAALEHLTLVREVDLRQLDVLAGDVLPHVQLGPVGQREDADVLAGGVPAVVQVPQFGALAARVPLGELVAQAEHPLLGAGLLLVAASAAEDRVELLRLDLLRQRQRLQRVAGAVGTLLEHTAVDVVLDGGHMQAQPVPRHHAVAVGEDLGEVVPGVHVEQGEGHRRRREGLQRQVQHEDGVLAAGEEDHRPLELARHLTEDVHRLRLQRVQMRERVRGARALLGRGNGRRHASPLSVSSAWTAAADSWTVWCCDSMRRSGDSGSSYGSSTPVSPVSSPAACLAYSPFTSRTEHTSTGVATCTSMYAAPLFWWRPRTASRLSAYGAMTGTSALTPLRASS